MTAGEEYLSQVASQGNRLVLLDRDGTLTVERGYVTEPEALHLVPGAGAAVKRLNALGVPVALVSNQSAVGRGLMTEAALSRVHERLRELLAAEGAALDGIYACLHAPEAGCACRKPKTELLTRAASELGGDLARSFVVGDNATDVAAGRAVGAFTILVLTGHGPAMLENGAAPDRVADDLSAAVGLIEEEIRAQPS
jgi:D-glycero-D-manno-heptose 1,7-bisphosphate phosphatase